MKPQELKTERIEFDKQVQGVIAKVTILKKKQPTVEAEIIKLESELGELAKEREGCSVKALADKEPQAIVRLQELRDRTLEVQLELGDFRGAKACLDTEMAQLEVKQKGLEGQAIELEREERRQKRFERHTAIEHAIKTYVTLAFDIFIQDLENFSWLENHGFHGEMRTPTPEDYSQVIQVRLEKARWEYKQRKLEVLENG